MHFYQDGELIMKDIRTVTRDGILVIQLSRGRANAIRRTMLEELNSALDQAASDDSVRGLVLESSVPGFFSSGFDIDQVSALDREGMTLFIARFIDLYESLHLLPKPTVAAVSGTAYAGGAILALACDVRIFASGAFGFALNGINLGVSLPPGVIRMLSSEVGTAHAREILLTGSRISPARAVEIGLAHELVRPELVSERAFARCRKLATKPPEAYAAMKQSLREVSGRYTPGQDHDTLESFLAQWFSPEAVSRRRALLESLRARRDEQPSES